MHDAARAHDRFPPTAQRYPTIWLARALTETGRVVIVDRADESSQVAGVRAGLETLRDDQRFEATALQTWDAKGWDGIALDVLV
ncbi:hypothetical protein [Microbacterium lacticum]